jgi:hypothetical protein
MQCAKYLLIGPRKQASKKGIFLFTHFEQGFLCSALLKAADRQEVEAALEHTAFVAGWKVGGAA